MKVAIFFMIKQREKYLSRMGNVDVLVEDSPKNIAGLDETTKGMLVAMPWNENGWNIKSILDELTKNDRGK